MNELSSPQRNEITITGSELLKEYKRLWFEIN